MAHHLLYSAPPERLETGVDEEPEVGPWHLYARLARPGLIAMRGVRRTTGLDLFLLDDAMDGVEDVAEIIGYGLENTGEESLPSTWKHFEERNQDETLPKGCLFLTFLRLNWDVLMTPGVWSQYDKDMKPPSRSQVLKAFVSSLTKAVRDGEEADRPLHFHLTGGTGDCDLFITGLVNLRSSLDRFLLILAQLGTDSLAAAMGISPDLVRSVSQWHPIAAASTTELAVPWDLYEKVLEATGAAVEEAGTRPEAEINLPFPETPAEAALRDTIDPYLQNGLRSAIFLRRTRSFLCDVRSEVGAVLAPKSWMLQIVIGDADMLLRRESPLPAGHPGDGGGMKIVPDEGEKVENLSNLLILLGRLDAKGTGNDDFPRRIAVVLSFDDRDTDHNKKRDSFLKRDMFLTVISQNPKPGRCPTRNHEVDKKELKKLADYLTHMQPLRRREEFRILERMVERAVTLQRQSDLSRALRTVAVLTLRRLAHFLPTDENEQGNDGQAEFHNQIVESGIHLELALSHHARGSVPLLLSTTPQARSMDHFGSETMITSALGAPASSVARRLYEALKPDSPPKGRDEDRDWEELMDTLKDMRSPILYASHDPDFALVPLLGFIRLPRWVIWYPTVSSSILHEMGHAVFNDGQVRLQACNVIRCALRLMARLKKYPKPFKKKDLALYGKHESRDVNQLGGFGKVPAALVWTAALLKEGMAQLNVEPTATVPLEEWGGQLDEVTAELFCHCYSYPRSTADASPGSEAARHIHDALEHIAPLAHRTRSSHRLLFICRELAVRIAIQLIEAETSPWHLTEAQLAKVVNQQVEFFRVCLAEWQNDPPEPFRDGKNFRLIDDVGEIYQEACLFSPLKAKSLTQHYGNAVGKTVQWGIFVALLATSHKVPLKFDGSFSITQKLWQAILSTSRSADDADPEWKDREKELVKDLQQGRVPSYISKWPERLPRGLHTAIRRDDGSVKLPQRFALTIALADWMITHDEQDKEPQ